MGRNNKVGRLRNNANIKDDMLADFYLSGHPLIDCAEKFGCCTATVKSHLRRVGIKTDSFNNSDIAKQRHIACATRGKNIPHDNEIKSMYIDDNLDTKTIAEKYGLHYNTIRNRVRRLGLRKSRKSVSTSMMNRHSKKYGCSHPAQRLDTLRKTRRSTVVVRYTSQSGQEYCFRSLTELAYALYLDHKNLNWEYETIRVPYIDSTTGKNRIYLVDFLVNYQDGSVHWVEVKPTARMVSADKLGAAAVNANLNNAEYQIMSQQERTDSRALLNTGFRVGYYNYIHKTPSRSAKMITRWFKTRSEAIQYTEHGWKRSHIKDYSDYLFALKMVRK